MKPWQHNYGKSDMIKRIKQTKPPTSEQREWIMIIVFVAVACVIAAAVINYLAPEGISEYPATEVRV